MYGKVLGLLVLRTIHQSLLYSDATSFASVICIGLKILTVPSFSVTLIVIIFVFVYRSSPSSSRSLVSRRRLYSRL